MKLKGFHIGMSVGLMLFIVISVLVFGGALYYDVHHSSKQAKVEYSGKVTSMSTLSPEQTIKREEIKQIIKTATIQTLREIEARGGYLRAYRDNYYPNKSVDYALTFVPLYRACGKVHYPSWDLIEREIKAKVAYLIDKKLRTLEKTTPTFEYTSPPIIEINTLDDKIQVYATVYTKYKGKAIPESYDVVVPTRIKEIHAFATNFSNMMSKLRLVDYYVINTLYDAEDHYFPIIGSLTECGDSISLSSADLSRHFYKLYSYTLANTEFFKKPKFKEEDAPHYYIPRVNGKIYKGLSVQFRIPDDYIMVFPSGISITNNVWLSYLIPPIPECIQRYDARPSFYISYIVTAKDDLLGQDAFYNFAEFSIIDKAMPSKCSFNDYPDNTGMMLFDDDIVDNSKLEDKIRTEKETKCEKEGQEIRIKVVDESGNPVEGARATYGECYLGKSDTSGMIKGYGIYKEDNYLSVSKNGYIAYTSKLNDLKGEKVVRLVKDKERSVDVDYVYIEGDLEDTDYGSARESIKIGGEGVSDKYLLIDRCAVENYPRDKGLDVKVSFNSNFVFGKVGQKIKPEEVTKRGIYDFKLVDFPNIDYSYSGEQITTESNDIGNLLDDVTIEGADDPSNYDKGKVSVGVMPYYVHSVIRKGKLSIADYVDVINASSSSLYVNIPLFYINNRENALKIEHSDIRIVNDHYVDPMMWGALKYQGKYYKIYDKEKKILKDVCGISSFVKSPYKYVYPVNPDASIEAKYDRYKHIAQECLGSDKVVDDNCKEETDPVSGETILSCNFDAIRSTIISQSNNKCMVY